MDIGIYYDAVKTLFAGLNPYVKLLSYSTPHNYPPTSFLFFWPMRFFRLEELIPIWQYASFIPLFITIYLLTEKNLKKTFLFFLLFTLLFFPTKFNFGMGQINTWIVLLVVLGVGSPIFLAVATAIKVIPAIFLLVFFAKRNLLYLVKFFVYLSALVLISTAIVPIEWQWVYYTDIFFRGFADVGKGVYYNQSLAGFTFRFFENPLLAKFSFYALSSIVTLISFLKLRKLDIKNCFAIVSCLHLMVSPIAWQHHFVFAVVPLLVLVMTKRFDFWTAIAFLLIGANIKNPSDYTGSFKLLLSHQLWGTMILWASLIFGKDKSRVLFAIWIVLIVCSYVFYLLSKGGIVL